MSSAMKKLLIIVLILGNAVWCMHIDVKETELVNYFYDPNMQWRECVQDSFTHERWVCRFSFLPLADLPPLISTKLKIRSNNEYIYGKEYITPSVVTGITNKRQYVTICNSMFGEFLVIWYEKSNQRDSCKVSSSFFELRYVSHDEIKSLYVWKSDESAKYVPLNEELIIKRLVCCCIDEQMAIIHQLEEDDDALVVMINSNN